MFTLPFLARISYVERRLLRFTLLEANQCKKTAWLFLNKIVRLFLSLSLAILILM